VFPANIVPVVTAEVLKSPIFEIFLVAVTKESELLNVAVKRQVFEPELQ